MGFFFPPCTGSQFWLLPGVAWCMMGGLWSDCSPGGPRPMGGATGGIGIHGLASAGFLPPLREEAAAPGPCAEVGLTRTARAPGSWGRLVGREDCVHWFVGCWVQHSRQRNPSKPCYPVSADQAHPVTWELIRNAQPQAPYDFTPVWSLMNKMSHQAK